MKGRDDSVIYEAICILLRSHDVVISVNKNEVAAYLTQFSEIKTPPWTLGFLRIKLKLHPEGQTGEDLAVRKKKLTQDELVQFIRTIKSVTLYRKLDITGSWRPKSKKMPYSKNLLLLEYASGTTALITDLEILKNQNTLSNLLMKHGAEEDSTFGNIKKQKAFPWETEKQSVVYTGENEIFYDHLHEAIIQQIKRLVGMHPSKQMNIIDGACGRGKLAKKMENAFPQATITAFDFNPQNVTEAKENYDGKVTFMEGDLLEFDHVLHASSKVNVDSENSLNIVTLSGAITRMVLRDVYEGMTAYQSIAKNSAIHYMIAGGIGHEMINRYLARQMGFLQHALLSSEAMPMSSSNPLLFVLERMRFDHVIAMKRKKLKEGLLDLRFCPNPAEIIRALRKEIIDQCQLIDLSFCLYDESVAEVLKEVLSESPRIGLVFQHHNDDFLEAFTDHFLGSACVFTVMNAERAVKHEVALTNYMKRLIKCGDQYISITDWAGETNAAHDKKPLQFFEYCQFYKLPLPSVEKLFLLYARQALPGGYEAIKSSFDAMSTLNFLSALESKKAGLYMGEEGMIGFDCTAEKLHSEAKRKCDLLETKVNALISQMESEMQDGDFSRLPLLFFILTQGLVIHIHIIGDTSLFAGGQILGRIGRDHEKMCTLFEKLAEIDPVKFKVQDMKWLQEKLREQSGVMTQRKRMLREAIDDYGARLGQSSRDPDRGSSDASSPSADPSSFSRKKSGS